MVKKIFIITALTASTFALSCTVNAMNDIKSGYSLWLTNNCTNEAADRTIDYQVKIIAVNNDGSPKAAMTAINYGDKVVLQVIYGKNGNGVITNPVRYWYVDNDGWLKKDGTTIDATKSVFIITKGLGDTTGKPVVNDPNSRFSFKTWIVEANKPNGCFISTRYNKPGWVMWGDAGTNNSWEAHTATLR